MNNTKDNMLTVSIRDASGRVTAWWKNFIKQRPNDQSLNDALLLHDAHDIHVSFDNIVFHSQESYLLFLLKFS